MNRPVISYYSPAGGGYGDPLQRDISMVLDDVLDEIISIDDARKDYVVILIKTDDGCGWVSDENATEKLRREMGLGNRRSNNLRAC